MEKFNTSIQQPWNAMSVINSQSGIRDLNNPRPNIAQPLPSKPEEEPDKKEEDPSKKKKKKNIYEITC